MEHLLQWSKCLIFHDIFKYIIFQRCQKALSWGKAGIILAQNDDGPLKWANGPYPIQIHANFQILMGHLNFLWALCKI